LPASSPTVQSGIPNVFDSGGWIPTDSASGAGGTGGTGGAVTIEITDANGDGKHEVKVTAPENVTVSLDAKVGNEEIKGDFKVGK
jgi:hypothetical protein